MVTRRIGTVAALLALTAGAGEAAAAGDGFETIVLKDGQRVVGDVVAEKPEALYVDLGYDLLKLPRESIVRRSQGEEAAGEVAAKPGTTVADPSGFFTTGSLRPAPVKELVAKYGEAVVAIETPSGKGSGFLINDQGYAITNAHVIEGETRIAAILYHNAPGGGLSRRRVEDVEIVALNPFFDLALIKLPLGDAVKPGHAILGSDEVNSGDSVFAVGNPLGMERTVTQGIVSNRSRNLEGQLYIQTDTAINPGNSGGPLINIEGELIGINVAVRANAQGLGFALPIDEVKRVAAEMLSTRRLAATWHGVVAAETTRGDRRVLVATEVLRGGPGEAAGIRPGDELVRIAGMPVSNVLDVERAFLDARPGTPSQVVVRRGGTEAALALEVRPVANGGAALASFEPGDPIWDSLGLKTAPAASDQVVGVNPKLRGGLFIQAVLPGSPAAAAALQRGDILVGMNVGDRNWETIRPDHIIHVLSQPEAVQTDSALLYVIRRNSLEQRRISLADPRVKNIVAQ